MLALGMFPRRSKGNNFMFLDHCNECMFITLRISSMMKFNSLNLISKNHRT